MAHLVKGLGELVGVAFVKPVEVGPHHLLDRFDLASRRSERLFRSDKSALEWFLAFTGPGDRAFLTWRQSPSEPPNAMPRASVEAPACSVSPASMFVMKDRGTMRVIGTMLMPVCPGLMLA